MFLADMPGWVHVQKSSLEIDARRKMQVARAIWEESEMSSCEESGRESAPDKGAPKTPRLNIYTS